MVSKATLDNVAFPSEGSSLLSGDRCGLARVFEGVGGSSRVVGEMGIEASCEFIGQADVRVISHKSARSAEGFMICQGISNAAAAARIVLVLVDHHNILSFLKQRLSTHRAALS